MQILGFHPHGWNQKPWGGGLRHLCFTNLSLPTQVSRIPGHPPPEETGTEYRLTQYWAPQVTQPRG